MTFMLQFLRKNQGILLTAAVFLELQLFVCLLAGILFLRGGVW